MFLFEEIFKETIWGGDRILQMKELAAESHDVGESWEISALDGDLTRVLEGEDKGKSLNELSEKYGATLLGRHVYDRYGTRFPLLVKFIDAHHDLSIQVHPNDRLAMARHGCNGKTEMWYVMESGPLGKLLVGFDKDITPDEYESAVARGEIASKMRSHSVKSGDVFFLPSGRIHAICSGVLLAEIQQSSDITYRIFDYNRKDINGNPRELHTDLAKDALDYQSQADYQTHYTAQPNQAVELVACPYFTTELISIDHDLNLETGKNDSFSILLCVEGEVEVTQTDGINPGWTVLTQGHTILVAASASSVCLKPAIASKLLRVWVP